MMGQWRQFQGRHEGFIHERFHLLLPLHLHDRMNVTLGNQLPSLVMFLPSLRDQKRLALLDTISTETASSPGVRNPSSLASGSSP